MEARQLICDGGLGPKDVKFLDAVFESAWREIESRFNSDEQREAEAAKLRLARIIVTLGKYHHDYVAAELQAMSIEVFDMRPPTQEPL
jgi:hypothetical protein